MLNPRTILQETHKSPVHVPVQYMYIYIFVYIYIYVYIYTIYDICITLYNPVISWITPPRGLNMKPPRWDAAPAASPPVLLWRSNVPGDQVSQVSRSTENKRFSERNQWTKYMYYVYIYMMIVQNDGSSKFRPFSRCHSGNKQKYMGFRTTPISEISTTSLWITLNYYDLKGPDQKSRGNHHPSSLTGNEDALRGWYPKNLWLVYCKDIINDKHW